VPGAAWSGALLRHEFAQAAASYDAAAVLARETGKRLAERLAYTKITPARFADIGCATGDGLRLLQAAYPQAQPLAIDFAQPMLKAVRSRMPFMKRVTSQLLGGGPGLIQADVRQLPLADASLNLVWSNLMLHWLDDPMPALRELGRVMETGGLITFTLLGPDTLKEWREALQHVLQPQVGAGNTAIAVPLRRFPDMHDIGDMLVAAGFGDPVMDREDIVLTYATPRLLIADQRHLGVRNRIFGALDWRSARRAFACWPRNAEGRLPVTFEVVYGQAWKAPPRPARMTAEGHPIVSFMPRR
jgi:malonyl-CoA O-methyltransferase